MKVQFATLNNDLLNNVCEVRFAKRTSSASNPTYRRMWCTKSYELLASVNGKITLNYREPKHQKQINEEVKDVLVVWDILMQDYRTVSLDDCDLIRKIPATEQFWKFFNENIYPMSAGDKLAFMNT